MTTPVYVGALGKAGRYVGSLTDTAIYFGVESLWPATTVMPSWIANTTFQSGTGALTVDFTGTGRQAGDFLVVAIESANQAVNAPPAGWAFLPGSPQSTGTANAAGGVRLTLVGRYSDGTETTVAIPDTGNHTTAIGAVFRDVLPGLQQNLIKNSANMLSTSDWAVYDDNNVSAAISATSHTDPDGNPAFKISFGSTYREYLAFYPNDNTVCAPNTTYRVEIWAMVETGTAKFSFDTYDSNDHFSSDFTVTTAGDVFHFDYTTGNSTTLKYAQLWQLTSASTAEAAALIVGKARISTVSGAEYVRTSTAPVTNFKGINAYAGTAQASNATFTLPGVTPTVAQCLIAHFIANDRDANSMANLGVPANANLTNLTKRFDQTVDAGAGGGLALITGGKETATATGNTTVTNVAANTNASITLALNPAV